MNRMSIVFAWLAAALAGLAAAAGLTGRVYRDVPAMVEQAQAADLATLFVAVPLVAIGLTRRAYLVVAAGVAYLAYTYAIFSFEIVLNSLAAVYIAILALSTWALVLGLYQPAAEGGPSLPRRSTAAFLALVALLFAGLWLSEIASAMTSGTLPPGVAALEVPTSAVYALDLGFVLPVFVLTAAGLARGMRRAFPAAFACLVFLLLMALSILPMFAFEAARGQLSDPVAPVIFVAIAVVAGLLLGFGGMPRPASVGRSVAAA